MAGGEGRMCGWREGRKPEDVILAPASCMGGMLVWGGGMWLVRGAALCSVLQQGGEQGGDGAGHV